MGLQPGSGARVNAAGDILAGDTIPFDRHQMAAGTHTAFDRRHGARNQLVLGRQFYSLSQRTGS